MIGIGRSETLVGKAKIAFVQAVDVVCLTRAVGLGTMIKALSYDPGAIGWKEAHAKDQARLARIQAEKEQQTHVPTTGSSKVNLNKGLTHG
jgi:hypothetical protein